MSLKFLWGNAKISSHGWRYFESRLVNSFISPHLTHSSAFPHQAFPKRWSSWWLCTVDLADHQLKLPISFCNDFQLGLLQSSLRTPWCSAPSAAPTQCAAQHPHTFLPSKYSPFPSTLCCPHALLRPPSILQVTFVMGILRLGF